jgi:hypothetical protein
MPMHFTIPVWFFGFDSAMYFLSSLIGFFVSFYFHKIYSLSSHKRHMYLYLGFLLLSVGLLGLSITSMFSYLVFNNCHEACVLGLADEAFSLEDFSYFTYFGLSIAAYILFMITYKPENFKFSKLIIFGFLIYMIALFVFLPTQESHVVWYSYHEHFHLTALLMIIFVTFRNAVNYNEKRSSNSLLVTISFGFLALFHLFHLFSPLSEWMYVFAHISMLTGFSCLLFMLLRLKK